MSWCGILSPYVQEAATWWGYPEMTTRPDDRIEQRRDGDIDFFAAEPDDLDRVVSSPQAFDNQWMPQDLLKTVMDQPRLSDAKVEKRRLPYVRTEYLRALVNTGQVVINRAYLYNNPAIYGDYAKPGKSREDFKRLLTSRVVIPYLYNETSPATEPEFTKRDQGWAGWIEVIKDCAPTCMRLSWENDEDNATQARRLLTTPFGQFIKNLNDLEVPLLAAEFAHDPEDAAAFGDRLGQVADWAYRRSQAKERLNREDVYRKFVVRDESDPDDRDYDPAKPFSAEIKQLTLGSVIELRSTPQWDRYYTVLDRFLTQPTLEAFGDADHGAEAVALAYRDVIKQAGTIAAEHSKAAVQQRWDPVIEITVEFAGAILSIFYNPAGAGSNAFRVVRGLAPGIGTRAAKAVFHLVIGRVTRSRARSRIDNSLRVLDTKLDHGRDDWKELVAGLKQQGFRDLDEYPAESGGLASMEKAAEV